MKKILLFASFLAACCMYHTVSAQEVEATDHILLGGHPLSIGAKAGAGIGQFTQPKSAMGASVGGFARWEPLSFLDVQLDLLYEVSGGGRTDLRRDFGFLAITPDESYDLTYINRQVLFHTVKNRLSARLSLPELEGAAIRPRLIVGVNNAVILAAWQYHDSYLAFENGTSVIVSDQKENVSGDYTKINLGGHLGFALDFNMPNGQVFTMELLYERGITDTNDILIGQPENIEVLRTQQLVWSFAYTLF
ncbi:hypothetical protein [Flagellimonas sp.]|uniref:hypothetical protein n=1 Tax=Flagellimonas sp. TaxID=2058762 RepID=UPI003F49F15A